MSSPIVSSICLCSGGARRRPPLCPRSNGRPGENLRESVSGTRINVQDGVRTPWRKRIDQALPLRRLEVYSRRRRRQPPDPSGGTTIPPVPPPKRHPYDQWSPDARALDLVGDKWTLLIIRDLAAGPAALRRAAARAARHLDRAAALAAEPDGRRRPAHPPALPRGAAARGLRADRALARADAGARRARALGLRLGLERPAPGRGRQHRRDLPARARAASTPADVERHRRPACWRGDTTTASSGSSRRAAT